MDKKSKVLVSIFVFVVLLSVVVTYNKYIINEDIKYYLDEDAFNKALLEEE